MQLYWRQLAHYLENTQENVNGCHWCGLALDAILTDEYAVVRNESWAAGLISQDVTDRVGKYWGVGSNTAIDPVPWSSEWRIRFSLQQLDVDRDQKQIGQIAVCYTLRPMIAASELRNLYESRY